MMKELILIVEDNEKSRKLLRDVLRAKGYDTIESETGEEAIKLCRENRPALVFMDIQLPGIDGIETLQLLRSEEDTAHIPVVAVTASAMEHDRVGIESAGFDGFHWKPIVVKRILEELRNLLDERANE